MSANNYISIRKKEDKFTAKELDADGGGVITNFGVFDTLEESIKVVNNYQMENEVEYGLDIRL